MSVQTTTQTQTNYLPVPETPSLLLALAMLFVPGMYAILLLSGAIVIGMGAAVVYGAYTMIAHQYYISYLLALMCILVLGVLVGIVGVIKGILAAIFPRPIFQPALIINRGSEPELGRFLISLCSKIDSMMPDAVFLSPEPGFAVTQGRIRDFNGEVNGRVMVIGLPTLGGLTVNEARAALAHEFAHFSGGDTAFSARVLPVYRGAIAALRHMTSASANYIEDSAFRQAAFNLPMIVPRLMLLAYIRIFDVLNMHISRTRERRADAVAVNACGSASCSKGLWKEVGIMGAFSDDSCLAVIRRVQASQGLSNHYAAFRAALPQLTGPAKSFAQKVYDMPQGIHDTHPCLKSRLQSVGNVSEQFDDTRPATVLLANLDQYEQQMHESMAAFSAMLQRVRQ